MTEAQQQFVSWLQMNNPTLYKATVSRVGMGDHDKTTWWGSFIGAAKELTPIIVGARSQKKLLNVQMKRAQQGLPPLNTSEIAPTVRVQAALSPDIKRIMIPALAVGGLLLLFFVMKKK